MKTFNRASVALLAVVFLFGLAGPITVLAASSPSLGTASTFSILSGTQVTNSGATTISGSVGIYPPGGGGTTGWGTVTLGGTLYNADGGGVAAGAQTDSNLAYTALASQTCNTTYVGVFKELAGETLAPGVYCADSFHLSSGTLTLSGTASDVWVFKSSSDLIVTGSSAKVIFSGAGLACNVWWGAVSTATLDVGSAFVGNILADTSITLASGATLNGRAHARTAEVTLVGNTISGPTCIAATPTPSSGGSRQGSINVVKRVINDNGGIKTIADFPLSINGITVTSGSTNDFNTNSDVFTVAEVSDPKYTRTFSGDCDSSGKLILNTGDLKFCIITNDDIGAPLVVPPVPPIIDVVKVPNPLALPAGPGSVVYTYTVRNIGIVPMTNVTLVGDTCSPIVLSSGDLNNNAKLDLNETWVYRCTTTLAATHTNTVVATGWANGLSAVDVASATVVVGLPIVPPLIHVTKVPDPLALRAGGGMVTYTEKITNPGTVALSNVRLTDDKCSPMKYISGDTNSDSKLDVTETWTYTCRTNLIKNTTNTATASGEANGLTVRDLAIATVLVSLPRLPDTGVSSESSGIIWAIVVLLGVIIVFSISLILALKKRAT